MEKTRGKTVERARGETREKILKAVKTKADITIEELAEIIGITGKGVEWQIKS